MSKTKLLVISVILLVAINLVMMWQMAHRPKHHGADNRDIIIEKLHFDEEQVHGYDLLVKAHQRDIRMHQDSLRDLRTALYSKALADNDSVMTQQLMTQIAAVQQSIEWIHFRHFEDIRALCREDQLAVFRSLTEDLAGMFNARKPLPNHQGQ